MYLPWATSLPKSTEFPGLDSCKPFKPVGMESPALKRVGVKVLKPLVKDGLNNLVDSIGDSVNLALVTCSNCTGVKWLNFPFVFEKQVLDKGRSWRNEQWLLFKGFLLKRST